LHRCCSLVDLEGAGSASSTQGSINVVAKTAKR
jgi:hypothetical protein